MLVELSVVEQRYRAVMEVLAGIPVTEVAARYRVSRQSVHTWVKRYRDGGMPGLADRSHRPRSCPHQLDSDVEALICELRRTHPRWGPRRLVHELARREVEPLPSRSTVYRVLLRAGLLEPVSRKRKRSEYRRWERSAPMQLWQMDIVGGVFLTDGTEVKIVTEIDDHSRFIVCCQVVARATGRAVSAAFAHALRRYGVPGEVLTDNGKQFTGRFGGPRAGEVLFDRICRDNGITHRLTAVRSPTTTGKIERFHGSLRRELLDHHEPFTSITHAQAVIDTWITGYNIDRPHQALDMTPPVDRFTTTDPEHARQAETLPLVLPAELDVIDNQHEPEPDAEIASMPVNLLRLNDMGPAPVAAPITIELDKTVPASGNLQVKGQQIWLGPDRAGTPITLRISTSLLRVLLAGVPIKTVASKLAASDLHALVHTQHARIIEGDTTTIQQPGSTAIEVERTVSAAATIALANKPITVGFSPAGRRVILRFEAGVMAVLDPTDRTLLRTLPSPLTTRAVAYLRGARPAGPPPTPPPAAPVTVERIVSSSGGIMIARQRIQIGRQHARKVLTLTLDETTIHVHDGPHLLATVPRTTNLAVTHKRAQNH
ncbi:IS481 family transposase [Kibdelosporangium aridum]|uniref:IS481 family transposase n=1 Tax=Kibdelosporangium aridum TaxID=2030 RepID=A0A428YYR3_KIBAR|nr:IS481 family transposase [Kibdelosporangium aridum]RSM75568.1 IS481 family transposase [Kibdelosporangium aridum]